jgi:hypothetical protein
MTALVIDAESLTADELDHLSGSISPVEARPPPLVGDQSSTPAAGGIRHCSDGVGVSDNRAVAMH